ncbi:glutamate-pyruvate aminotransferase AlaA [Arthrobacter sp. Hiyo6]|nr:glutamate-pyruvate aminotransferase AlaA [Arthrobacter sp. Hiyo6]
MRPMQHSSKLQNVRYELRGPILQAAKKMEAEGHRILKMNLATPRRLGWRPPNPWWST